jgi:hypothetical protein
MTTNLYSGMPATRHMSSAALPQSPTPATTASHCGISSMMRASAGAL